MIPDPIVDEIRQFRQEHAAEHGHDLRRIVADLKKREQATTHIVLNPGPKLRLRQAS